jgi:hypothetical protein
MLSLHSIPNVALENPPANTGHDRLRRLRKVRPDLNVGNQASHGCGLRLVLRMH